MKMIHQLVIALMLSTISSFSSSTLAKTIIIPIELNEFDQPFIELTIQGKTGKFLLDTGSQLAFHFTPDWLELLKDQLVYTDTYTYINSNNQPFANKQYQLQQLTIDGLDFDHLEVTEYQDWVVKKGDSPTPSQEPQYSVAGLGLFHHHLIVLDYQQKQLIISDDHTQMNDSSWVEIPFQRSEADLIINMSYLDHSYPFIFDTGANMSSIRSSLVPKDSPLKPCDFLADCQLVTMSPTDLPDRGSIELFLDEFSEQIEAAGFVGSNFLKKFRVKIDLSQQKIALKPIDPKHQKAS